MAERNVKIEVLATGVERAAAELKRMTEQLREMDAAAEEVVYSLDEPTDDASKARAKGLKDEADAVDGLAGKLLELGEAALGSGRKMAESALLKSLTKERIKGIQDQLGELGKTLEGLASSALREKGAEMFEGMSDGAKVFGETALSMVDGVAAGFAAGGPIGAAVGGLNSLIKTVVNEFTESQRRIKESEEELARAVEANAERARKRKQEATNKAIKDAYDAETRALKEQSEELERIRGLRGSQQDLEEAKDELGDIRARKAGVPEEVIELENISQELARRTGKARDELADARANAEILSKEANAAARKWHAIAAHQKEEKEKAEAEMIAAGNRAQEGHAAAARLEENLTILEETYNTQAESKVEQVGADVTGKMETIATNLQQSLETEIQEQGTKASAAAVAALGRLNEILADGTVGADEVDKLSTVLSELKGKQEAKDIAVLKGLQDLTGLVGLYTTQYQEVLSKIGDQRRALSSQGDRMSTALRQ